MKKFLTVLLVIAVMFTFSFSTAFAAYAPTAETKVTLQTEAQKALDAALANVDVAKANYFRFYTAQSAPNYSGVTISKDAALTQADAAVALIKAEITKVYNSVIMEINAGSVGDGGDTTIADAVDYIKATINTEYEKYDTTSEFAGVLFGTGANAVIADAEDKLVEAELEVVKADVLETLAKAETVLGNYSTTLPTNANVDTDGDGVADTWMSNYDIVKYLIDEAKANVADAEFDATDATAKAATATLITTTVPALDDFVTVDKDGKIGVNYYTVSGEFEVVGKSGAVPTAAADEKADKTTAELIAYYQAKFEGEVLLQKAYLRKALTELIAADIYTDTQEAAWAATLAGMDEDFAAVLENGKAVIGYAEGDETAVQNAYNTVATAYVSYQYVGTGSGTAYKYVPNATLQGAIDNCDLVAAVKALAESKKALTGVSGVALYDAEAIADKLEDDIEDIYTNVVNAITATAVYGMSADEDLVKNEMALVLGDKAATKVTLNKVNYPTVDEWSVEYGATKKFADSTKAAEAKAIVAETKAAIRAAKTVEEVDAAFVAGYAKYDAVATRADLEKYQASATKIVDAYEARLAAALVTKQAEVGSTFAKTYDCNKTPDFVDNLSVKYLQKAYDATELEAKYQAALAEIENLKTIAELQAEAKAINDEILALGKTKLTSADEATVLALIKKENALAAYITLIDANGTYTTYNATTTFKTTMQNLVKADLDAAKKAIGTVTVEDEAAINDLVAKAAAYKTNYGSAYDLGTLEADLLAAKVAAVNAAIGVINANANPLDIDAIKAARVAYDALAEKAILVEDAMYTKLLSLENLAGVAEEAEEAEIIASVESLKLKASSTKGKGWIKVTWKVTGDTENVEGYQLYKSTKAQKGYKKCITTTKTSFKNTKNIKSGTRYYYKVRAFVTVDGVKYYSDWSNKANRVAL